MGCICRTTPFKIFIQGLKQVHKIENTPSSLLRIRAPLPTQPVRCHDGFAFAHQTRSLHASRYLNQEASDAPTSPPQGNEPAPASPSSNDNSTSKASTATSDQVAAGKPRSFKPSNVPRTYKKAHFGSGDGRDGQKPRQPHFKSLRNINRDDGYQTQQPEGFRGVRIEKPKGPSQGVPQSKEALWKSQRVALKEKFPEGWRPRKRLSPDALTGIRALNAQFPETYTTTALAKKFEVSPEVIRRILRSKWTPSVEEEENRNERWFRRGKSVWETRAALGIKPPQKWRHEGIARDPTYHVWRKDAIQRNRDAEEKDSKIVFGRSNNQRGR